MVIKPKETTVAYRCPECGTAILGFAGRFALHAGLVRLKCSCGGSALDITVTNDKKLRLSVPCLYCKQNHSFTVTESVFFDHDEFFLGCPYSGMDIAFIGTREKVDEALLRSGQELSELLKNLEAEKLSDIQPEDMEEEEILPDPTVYDAIRFLMKDLEEEGKIDCPCHGGEYDLRFAPGGIEIYCPACGATHLFPTESASSVEDFLSTDSLLLQ